MKIFVGFVIGFVMGLFVFFNVSPESFEKNTYVLGENKQAEEQEIILEFEAVAPTVTLIPAITNTPTPSLTPIPTPTFTPAPFPTPISAPPQLEHYFNQYAGHYGINKQLLIKIAWCESRFDTGAVNGPYLGLYQFIADLKKTPESDSGDELSSGMSSSLRGYPPRAVSAGRMP